MSGRGRSLALGLYGADRRRHQHERLRARARPPRLCEGAMCFAAKSPRFSRQPRASWLVTATEKDRVGRSGCGRGRCDRMSLLRLLTTARCTQIPANTDDHYSRRSLPSPTPNAASPASSSVSPTAPCGISTATPLFDFARACALAGRPNCCSSHSGHWHSTSSATTSHAGLASV